LTPAPEGGATPFDMARDGNDRIVVQLPEAGGLRGRPRPVRVKKLIESTEEPSIKAIFMFGSAFLRHIHQTFFQTPLRCQSLSLLQHVEGEPYSFGRAFHGWPSRSRAFLLGTMGLPGVPGGFSLESGAPWCAIDRSLRPFQA
jgi:hypothetical protein